MVCSGCGKKTPDPESIANRIVHIIVDNGEVKKLSGQPIGQPIQQSKTSLPTKSVTPPGRKVPLPVVDEIRDARRKLGIV